MEKQETQSEYETETLHVPCSIRLAACIWDVDLDQRRHSPTAGFSHEGTTAHPEHKVVWLCHQWFCSEPDKADGSTPHHSRQKTLTARTCLPPTTRLASPQYPPALPCPRLEVSTWSAKEDLDTTGGRGSRVHSRLAVVIGAGSLIVEVATALGGQAQQWVSEWWFPIVLNIAADAGVSLRCVVLMKSVDLVLDTTFAMSARLHQGTGDILHTLSWAADWLPRSASSVSCLNYLHILYLYIILYLYLHLFLVVKIQPLPTPPTCCFGSISQAIFWHDRV